MTAESPSVPTPDAASTAAGGQESSRLLLVDEPDGSGRTTATMLASLAARLAALHTISGADAIGALTSGYAAVGREFAKTADGRRLFEAISRGRAGGNGEQLWNSLLIGKWATSLPPTPVLDQLRNDLALLLAPDLDAAFQLPPMPADIAGVGRTDPEPATPVHYLLGMWVFAREVVAGIKALAAATMPPRPRVVRADTGQPDVRGPLLP
jgi:hypothetical protein